MARKPGLARQPVASARGSGACTVTPAPASDETWPQLRCGAAWGCWGTPLCLPGAECAAWPCATPRTEAGPAAHLAHLSTCSPSQMLPTAPNWSAP